MTCGSDLPSLGQEIPKIALPTLNREFLLILANSKFFLVILDLKTML